MRARGRREEHNARGRRRRAFHADFEATRASALKSRAKCSARLIVRVCACVCFLCFRRRVVFFFSLREREGTSGYWRIVHTKRFRERWWIVGSAA